MPKFMYDDYDDYDDNNDYDDVSFKRLQGDVYLGVLGLNYTL
jgi:hypothetical protein